MSSSTEQVQNILWDLDGHISEIEEYFGFYIEKRLLSMDKKLFTIPYDERLQFKEDVKKLEKRLDDINFKNNIFNR